MKDINISNLKYFVIPCNISITDFNKTLLRIIIKRFDNLKFMKEFGFYSKPRDKNNFCYSNGYFEEDEN